MPAQDPRKFSPSVARNRDALRDAVAPHLPENGLLLEIASGSGEHMVHFSAAFSSLQFQPSDPAPDARASIDAWCADIPNVQPALDINASATWPIDRADVIFNANMIHISPWIATTGLIGSAARILPSGGKLITYGPYRINGQHISDGNAAFDARLRAENPCWGIRDLEAVDDVARQAGFAAAHIVDMPANNKTLVFERR